MVECPYECEGTIDDFGVCEACGRRVELNPISRVLTSGSDEEVHATAYEAGLAGAASPLLAQWSPRIWRKGRYLAILFGVLIGMAMHLHPPEWMFSLIVLAGYPVIFSLALVRVFGWAAFRIVDLEGSFGVLVACPWAYEYGYADAKENLQTEVEFHFD